MKKNQKNTFFLNIHPYFFALFCVFSLYSHNKDLVAPAYAFWPVIIVLSTTLLTHIICKTLVKDKYRTGLLVSIFIFTFLSFGHLSGVFAFFVNETIAFSITLFLWLSLILFSFLKLKNSQKNFRKSAFYLNLFAIILTFISLANILFYEIKSKSASELINLANEKNISPSNGEKPDIYYIVLDGFARQDVLKKIYGNDNSNFITSLENLGFFVANQSTTNYPQTYLSISSTLNMQYLDDVVLNVGKKSTDRGPLRKLIKDNRVYQKLKENNYKFVSFPHTWTGTANNQHTDIFMQNEMGLGEFGDLMIDLTPISIFARKNIQLEQHRGKILNVFKNMPNVAKIEDPTFTYTHILAPHPPFIFKKDGETTDIGGKMYGNDGSHYFEIHPDKEEYRRMYAEQLTFVAQKTLEMINGILQNSTKKPVIIIQSDHGPGLGLDWENEDASDLTERFGILNAYLLPTDEQTKLYESITPVNSFRVVFNNIFDLDYKLLPDKNYFVRWSSPYEHIDVTESVQ